jgi:hypothetical protein
MIRALKVALILYGAISILLGLLLIVVPQQAASMWGFEGISDIGVYIAALCGISFVAPGVGLIIAGQDPLRHITWVKFAILWAILAVVAGLLSIIRGAADFSQVGTGIILDSVFAVVFLALYPYRAVKS